ncbi:hypothetical protein [Amycolatopsis sp. MtRt-6]|uniref:hypothetical protein n=1 Tax=Amycolatopsis sp. MtRt-6 TaxID=2792782 RepID=UPI001A8FFEFD|nr:hypothetical protein [Amycolatopsis sp. MtRt-6]
MVTEGPLTAAQIYEQITGGEGTQSLADAQDSSNNLTQRMIERAERIAALRAKTMSGWQGGAGSAAADSTAPLIQAAMDDAIHLKNAQTAVEAQIGAFGTAKNSVKPVAARPPDITANDLYNTLAGDGKSYQTKVAGWQADSQANIDAFRVYHSASTTNGTQMPAQYAQLSDSGASITMDTGTPPPTDKPTGTDTGQSTQDQRQTRQPGIPERSQYRPGTQTGQDRTAQNQTGQSQTGQNQAGQGTTEQNQISGRPPGIPSDGTHANSYVPKPVIPPAASTGYQFGPTGQPINSLGPYGSGEFGPGTGYGSGTGYGPGSGTGGYRGTGSGAVNEPGARGLGPGSGSGRGLPGASVAGGRPGAPGVAGGRGAGGIPMGALGAGQGKKEEDTEKKAAAYLRNPDPDATFGGDIEKPMPPVIGEKRAQR